MKPKNLRVGFIGLGLMGSPMAKNILKSGFQLTVYNRTRSKTMELQKLGAHVAQYPKDVAIHSDVVIIMVTAPGDVETVLFGENGVVKGYHDGLYVVDTSTIGPTSAKIISKKLESHAIVFLDAPVTGSTPKAATGELTIFVGGNLRDFEFILPVLQAMGTSIHHMGDVGMGQAIKMVNNYLIAASIVIAAEGMILADSMALPRSKVEEILGNAPATSAMMKLKMPNFVTDSYPLLFSMSNMYKDVRLAEAEFAIQNFSLPVFRHVKKLYEKAMKAGLANADFSEIIKLCRT